MTNYKNILHLVDSKTSLDFNFKKRTRRIGKFYKVIKRVKKYNTSKLLRVVYQKNRFKKPLRTLSCARSKKQNIAFNP